MLFAIATTISLALNNGDTYSFPKLKNYYKRVGNKYALTIFRNIPTHDIEIEKQVNYNYNYTEIKYEKNIEISGYFQSYKFINEDIKKLFSPTDEIISYLNEKYNINSIDNSVSIHIRRGDYLKIQHVFMIYGEKYILDAMDIIYQKLNIKLTLFVFSDDIEWCKNNILKNTEHIVHYVENEDDINSLYLMSLCKHNIITNSTYSRWGGIFKQ